MKASGKWLVLQLFDVEPEPATLPQCRAKSRVDQIEVGLNVTGFVHFETVMVSKYFRFKHQIPCRTNYKVFGLILTKSKNVTSYRNFPR